MYRQHFGLTHAPLGKECKELWNHDQLTDLERQFKWLLQSPGLGLRHIASSLNPHRYLVQYIAETDFGRVDLYRQLALGLNLSPVFRRAQMWRDIKDHITHLATQKNILLVLIIDEAQNLPPEFLKDFPSFLNFVFDSKDYMTVWLVGHSEFARTIDRANNAALASRIQARCTFQPINDRDAFKQLLLHGLTQAGCVSTILSDSAIEILRMASKGNPRQLHRLLVAALQLATDQKLNHLPDEIVKDAIEILRLG
jgi:MSHA biogenesis protein MshM